MSKFSLRLVDDSSAKGGNSGKIGLRQNMMKMPDTVPKSDFPKEFQIKGKSAREMKKSLVMTMDKMKKVQFKEEQIDMSGFGSSKADDQEYRGKRRVQYNPFANSAGFVANVGGYNEGGSQNVPKKKEKNFIVKPRFRIGKRNKKSNLPVVINEPDPFEEQLKTTDFAVPVRSGVTIKS